MKKNKKKTIPKKNVSRKQIKKVPKRKVNSSSKKTQRYEKVKVRKIKYGRIFLVLVILFLLIYLFVNLVHFPIKNIFITGNKILSDQEIIEMAGMQNYPSIFYSPSYSIEKKLEKNIYIKSAKVRKSKLKEIDIVIKENRPLFYDSSNSKTVFEDHQTLNTVLNVPVLLNYVPDTIYDLFLSKMAIIDQDILEKISEIKYDPNTVDEERFYLAMTDGNYVYLTLEGFEKINKYDDIYLDIIDKYGKKVGILYLDSGEYFKVME